MGRGIIYNKIVTSELWDEVNKENKTLVSDFLAYKKSVKRSTGTLDQYHNNLKIFLVWNLQNNENKVFTEIKKREFIRFFNYVLEDLGSSPKRYTSHRATLSSFSNYIVDILDEDYVNYKNMIKSLEPITLDLVRTKTVVSEADMQECLDRLVKNEEYQIACFVALAMASGGRKAELLRFKCSYFTDDNIVFGSIYKTPEKVLTKGNLYKDRYTFVGQFKPYFDLWMAERKILGIDNEYLFVKKSTISSNHYEQAKIHTADGWAKKVSKMMEIDWYPHCMRHYWVTELKRKNLPVDVIQQLQGWATSDMVNIYNDLGLDVVLAQYFDEDGIKEVKEARLNDLH